MKEKDLRGILTKLEIPIIHKNTRGWLIAACPFAEFLHEKGTDASPSFNVKINPTGFSGFKCFSCHQTGTIASLATRLGYYRDDNLNYLALQAAVLEVPESFPDFEDVDDESYEATVTPIANCAIYLSMYPEAAGEQDAVDYLKSRGIGRRTAELLELRYDPEGRRIMFPVFDYKHDLFGLTGRSIIPDDQRPKDVVKVKNYAGLRKDRRLLGEQLISPGLPLLVVEGLFALARLIEIGARQICNPVATMGSDLSLTQRDLLLSHDAPIFLCYDNDSAGSIGLFGPWNSHTQTYEGGGAVDRLKEHAPVFVCEYPDETDEPDELLLCQVESMLRTEHVRV